MDYEPSAEEKTNKIKSGGSSTVNMEKHFIF